MKIEFLRTSMTDPVTGQSVPTVLAESMGVQIGTICKTQGAWTATAGGRASTDERKQAEYKLLADAKFWIWEQAVARRDALDGAEGYTTLHIIATRNGIKATTLAAVLARATELDGGNIARVVDAREDSRLVAWEWMEARLRLETIMLEGMGKDGVRGRYYAVRDPDVARQLQEEFPKDVTAGDKVNLRHVDGLEEPAPRAMRM